MSRQSHCEVGGEDESPDKGEVFHRLLAGLVSDAAEVGAGCENARTFMQLGFKPRVALVPATTELVVAPAFSL